MDIKEKILLDLFRRFAAEKIDFAFPTQTIYLENGNQEIPPSIKPSSEMAKRDF